MSKHVVVTLTLLAALVAAIFWLVSEPDYSIHHVAQDRKLSDLQTLRARVESDPASAMNWAELATAYFAEAQASGDQKMFELAIDAADRVLQFDSPYRKNARLVLADVASARHDFERALRYLDETEKESPNDVEVLPLRVIVLSGLGRYGEALKAAYELTEKKPSSASYRLRGIARESVGAFIEAERDYAAAIGLEEKTDLEGAIENRFHLARFYFRTGDPSRARRVLSPALKISEQAKLRGLLGEIELKEKNYDAARTAFETAQAIDKNPEWLVEQARVEKARGREERFRSLIDLAVELLKTEISAAPLAHPAALARALQLSAKSGELDLALELIKRELVKRQDVETLATAVRIALAQGDVARAKGWMAEIEKTGNRRDEFGELSRAVGAN
ncbi:MAG: tetratricopeptide repeat protein [Bdellovibrionota bacterium]